MVITMQAGGWGPDQNLKQINGLRQNRSFWCGPRRPTACAL